MTIEVAKKMLTAKIECMKRETSGIHTMCNYGDCDECELCYAQGAVGEQIEALEKAIEALNRSEIPNRCHDDKDINVPSNDCKYCHVVIEALKCMSLNADIINADAMHKLFVTGEMTMEDFRKMCGKGATMSVLIKGFEVPKDGCKDCVMVQRGKVFDTCPFLKQEVNGNVERGGKPTGCPLIEVPDTNVGDLISRRAAIDALDCINGTEEVLRSLPSAQPEIVRCKDCRWGRKTCGNIECSIDGNIPTGYHGYDWFCPNGERRTDE